MRDLLAGWVSVVDLTEQETGMMLALATGRAQSVEDQSRVGAFAEVKDAVLGEMSIAPDSVVVQMGQEDAHDLGRILFGTADASHQDGGKQPLLPIRTPETLAEVREGHPPHGQGISDGDLTIPGNIVIAQVLHPGRLLSAVDLGRKGDNRDYI